MHITLRAGGLALVLALLNCAVLRAQTAPAGSAPAAPSFPAPVQATTPRTSGGVPRPAAGTVTNTPGAAGTTAPALGGTGGMPAGGGRGGRRGGGLGGMGGMDPTSLLPKFTGAQEKLFGDTKAFSATLNAKTTATGNATISVPFEYANGKTRADVDMVKLMMASGDPQAMMMSGMVQSMGLSQIVAIMRPDQKIMLTIFPGIKSYLQLALPDPAANVTAATASPTPPAEAKMEVTELGKETLDGHPTVKNKVVLTDAAGKQQEYTVWNASDLKNFPIKIEPPAAPDGSTAVITFTDVKLDAPKDEDFEAPAGLTKYDSMQALTQVLMMQMMGGAGGAPGAMPGMAPGSMPGGMPATGGTRGAPAAP